MAVVCFHRPEEPNGYLSNWYLCSFSLDGVTYASTEQYLMAEKARIFGDAAIEKQILATDDVVLAQSLGRQVSGYNETVWNGMRQIVLYKGLLAKFGQNDDLKQMLLATGGATLAECSKSDKIWGIGLAMDDPDNQSVEKWHGRNLLGFALMRAREELKR